MDYSKLLSIILPSYYSKERIVNCYEKMRQLFDAENIPFELIVIDDGSKDDSYNIAVGLSRKYENVRAYQLSKNYGAYYAIMAGYSKVRGACATCVPDDEQNPYSVVIQMYRLWEQGNQVVVANRESRDDPFFSSLFANLFYVFINKLSDSLQYPKGGTDAILIDREVVDIINNRIHPINTNVYSEILRLGFSPVFCPYKRPLGLNGKKSRWTVKKKIRLAKDTFFSSSSFPIKFITRLGVFCSALSFVGIILYIYIKIWGNHMFWGQPVPGWTSIIIIICFFSGLILFSLGMIAEYIWRIYDEVKARPGYIIKKDERMDSKNSKSDE